MSGLFVMMPMFKASQRANRSRIPRVSRKRRSAGWYGSVAVPMTIGRTDGRRTDGPKVATQVAFEYAQQALLHEHPLLERLPPVRAAELVKFGV